MSDTPAGPPDDWFSGMPLFGDMARAMRGQGPINWDAARQFAQLGATGGESEPNVDPAARAAILDLARIAALHVGDVTGTDVSDIEPSCVTRSAWATATLEAYRPLFTDLATSLAADTSDTGDDPMAQMMAGITQMMAPAMLGMAVGSMVGHLAQGAFGVHDLPIPRARAVLELVPANVDGFATDWSLAADQMRLWVLAHEYAGHVVLTAPGLGPALADMVRTHVGAFRPDPDAVGQRLSSLDMSGDDPFTAIQQALGDPEVLLGAVRSPAQLEMEPRLDAAVAAVVGLTDWLVDAVAVRLVGGEALTIAEAVRRRRIEASPADVFVHRLLGIRLDDEQVRRGKQFVQGLVDRRGDNAVSALLSLDDACPTPSELDAPGLWLARVGLD